MFAFDRHPAYITIGDGIGTAGRFLGASWMKWLPVVLVATVAELAVSSLFANDLQSWYYVDQYTGRIVWSQDVGSKIGPFVAASAGLGLISLIAGWMFTAIAIAGLRNRPLSISWIVGRGLWTLWSSFLLGIAAFCAVVAVVIVLAVVAIATGPLVVSAGLAAFVVAIWVVIRLIFIPLAIFDGRGPIEGIFESWRLSERSVLRLLGWGLIVGLITFGMGIVASIASAPFSQSRSTLPAQAISSVTTQIATCFQLFLMAVLYESQRARRDLTLAAQQAGPYPPSPYPPGWYPAGPYAPGPYPPGQGYSVGPYPAAPYPPHPYAPGPYPPGQYAPPPGWPVDPAQAGSSDPDATLASADTPGPIEPPPPTEPDRS